MASTSALAPALNRSSTRLAVKEDPHSRAPSPGPQGPERSQDVEDLYRTGVYADPKPTKHWGIGQALFTPEHKKLLSRFRDECGRLYGHNKALRERAHTTEHRSRQLTGAVERLETLNAEFRLRLVDKNEQLRHLGDELKEAHQSLAEMDAVFAGNRSKRLSRLQAKNFEISDEARAELARIP